jgi:hypothetical protein
VITLAPEPGIDNKFYNVSQLGLVSDPVTEQSVLLTYLVLAPKGLSSFLIAYPPAPAAGRAECNLTFNVVDTEPPTVTCLESTVEPFLVASTAIELSPPCAQSTIRNRMLTRTVDVFCNRMDGTDNSRIDFITVTYSPDHLLPGKRQSNITATDLFGLNSTCTFNFEVYTDSDPTLICPISFSVQESSSTAITRAQVTLFAQDTRNGLSRLTMANLETTAQQDFVFFPFTKFTFNEPLFPVLAAGVNSFFVEVVTYPGKVVNCSFTVNLTVTPTSTELAAIESVLPTATPEQLVDLSRNISQVSQTTTRMSPVQVQRLSELVIAVSTRGNNVSNTSVFSNMFATIDRILQVNSSTARAIELSNSTLTDLRAAVTAMTVFTLEATGTQDTALQVGSSVCVCVSLCTCACVLIVCSGVSPRTGVGTQHSDRHPHTSSLTHPIAASVCGRQSGGARPEQQQHSLHRRSVQLHCLSSNRGDSACKRSRPHQSTWQAPGPYCGLSHSACFSNVIRGCFGLVHGRFSSRRCKAQR